GNAAMYGMIANIPLRGMIKNEVMKMMQDMYGPDGKLPFSTSDAQQDPLIIRVAAKALNAFDRFRKEK
ncbi:MAG: hypothetical protein JW920_12445, partial [Deltaproteobacteria bacterium]|nr:hypothetical protein [Deltaproteobacteria bacterium]